MIVIDTLYFLLVLYTGIIVAKKGNEATILTHILAALLILVSIKNLYDLYVV